MSCPSCGSKLDAAAASMSRENRPEVLDIGCKGQRSYAFQNYNVSTSFDASESSSHRLSFHQSATPVHNSLLTSRALPNKQIPPRDFSRKPPLIHFGSLFSRLKSHLRQVKETRDEDGLRRVLKSRFFSTFTSPASCTFDTIVEQRDSGPGYEVDTLEEQRISRIPACKYHAFTIRKAQVENLNGKKSTYVIFLGFSSLFILHWHDHSSEGIELIESSHQLVKGRDYHTHSLRREDFQANQSAVSYRSVSLGEKEALCVSQQGQIQKLLADLERKECDEN
jgi:hypothetical protein